MGQRVCGAIRLEVHGAIRLLGRTVWFPSVPIRYILVIRPGHLSVNMTPSILVAENICLFKQECV